MSDFDPDDLHFILSHPEAVARQMKKYRDRIAELEAEDKRIAELEVQRDKAIKCASKLDCMLASHAKSKRAYGKMQDLSERIREALQETDDD